MTTVTPLREPSEIELEHPAAASATAARRRKPPKLERMEVRLRGSMPGQEGAMTPAFY
jgi:hypothetical protein